MTRTEMKGERKRTTTTKQNTSNSSYLVEEVTPQIFSLSTRPFVTCIFTDALKSGLIGFSFLEFLFSTGIN